MADRAVVAQSAGVVPAAVAALTSAPASLDDDPLGDDYWGASNLQSKGKWRARMLNITGRVLGAANLPAWQAEIAANNFMATRANRNLGLSEEQFNAMMGNRNFSVDANGRVQQIAQGQGTYDDYVLNQYADTKAGKGKTKPISAPATKGSKFKRTVAGATGALAAPLVYDQAAQLGAAGMNQVGGWLGWDVNGTVCGQTSNMGALGGALNWLSGQNCDQWQFDHAYVPNSDLVDVQTVQAGPYAWWRSGYKTGIYWCGPLMPDVPSGTSFVLTLADGKTASVWGGAGWELPLICGGGQNPTRYLSSGDIVSVGVRVGSAPVVTYQVEKSKPDPERTVSCTVSYSEGGSTTVKANAYKDSDGSMVTPSCPPVPEGKTPSGVKITESAGGGADKTLYDEQTTDAYRDWVKNFPECGTGACLLDLLVKTDTDKAASCFDLEKGCDGWFEDPQRDEKYICRYGTKSVSLAECFVYSGLFKPGRLDVGAPYSDPMTGAWSGGTNSIGPDRQAMDQKVQSPNVMRSCNGMAVTGFDPVGFVMRPVQCALEWAFVPRPAVVDAGFAGAGKAWDGKAPQSVMAWAQNLKLTPAAQGCRRDVTLFGTTFPVVDNCPGSIMSSITGISRLLTTVGMVYLVIIVVRRQVAGMAGYNGGQS